VRVLHLTDHYLPVLGGIETHVSDLAGRQAARGDDVTVLTWTPARVEGRVSADAGPVRVHRVRSLLEGARLDVSAFDVVHVHVSVVAPFSAPLAALAARRGAPTVVTVHSMWNGLGPVPAVAAALSGLRSAPVVWTAVSTVAAARLQARLPGDVRVRVLPNAVAVAPRERTPVAGDGSVHLVSTMRVARRKRPLPLLAMVERLARDVEVPLRLTVVGDGPLRSRLERRAEAAGLEDVVVVTGRVERPEVRARLATADVYVAPAVLESFGLAALEARCVGLPVVGHAASGLVDFVEHGVDGLLAETDAELVRRLVDLVRDPAMRHRIAEHNRRVPTGLSWPAALERHDATYVSACRLAGRRRGRSLLVAADR